MIVRPGAGVARGSKEPALPGAGGREWRNRGMAARFRLEEEAATDFGPAGWQPPHHDEPGALFTAGSGTVPPGSCG